MSTKTNEFAKIGKLVDTIITRYREVRKDCGIPDNGWHSRTIERMATPFIKGYFTLAVVGKVSSGKSTFINALLGCKDLLPTGHDQTTCGVTYIEYGEKPEVTIVFGDGHKKVIKDDISGKIKPHVAIPEKYHHLPVNNIDDMIMGGFDFNKIWEVHNQLEEETLCPPIDKALLKEYVEQRKKKDIAIEVRMKYPFNEELKGWRVIDTPGIGAIGGIETRTKQLLATQKEDGSREVDAIIFLQNGSQTLDQTDTKKFMKEQLDNLTESDKGRLFYVLTHSSSSDFVTHKDSKIDFITQNYGSKIKVLTYADSLLYTFLTDLEGIDMSLDEFMTFAKLDNWAIDEWNTIMGILFQAKLHLQQTHESFNHDTMLRTVKEWSHFEELKNEINTFAKNEKQKTLRNLLNLIATDYLGFLHQLDKDKELVDGDLASIDNEIINVEKKRQGYNNLAQKADNLIKIDRINAEFDFIEKELRAFEGLKSIDRVRTSVTNLFDTVQKKEKEVFDDIIKQFSGFFKDFDSTDIVLESIDFYAIESAAGNFNKDKYIIEPARTETHWSGPDEYIPEKYDKDKIEEDKLRNFKALALKKARSQKDLFLPQIKVKADNMRNQIFNELNTKNKEEIERLEGLKSQLARKEKFKAEKDKFIAKSHAASKELIKLAQDYGYKF
ncbi:MAG: dynamin family protein [Bacteroidaceae bacterium]|nr:dynamin family protein [Bacteroidaceae bacterium]